jgi:septal ring factor EnvC (AmiA/AmiB activator)
MRGTMVTLLLAAIACAGCATKEEVEMMRSDIAAFKSQVSDDTKAMRSHMTSLDKRTQVVSVLQADLQAVKSYFKQVADKVRMMRDDVVKILDEQNMKIDGTRRTQIRLLLHQKKLMEASLVEIDSAMKVLQKALPDPAGSVTKEPPRPPIK